MLKDLTVTNFLEVLKSDAPAPGGGSAAALVGAIAAGLNLMVGELTLKSEKYSAVHAQMKELAATLTPAFTDLHKYIDEDTQAFNAVMAAYKLPKETDEEKAARSKAIQKAMVEAAELPLAVAKASLTVLQLSGQTLADGNPNAASDAAVGARMAHAALWSAVYNVKINLSSIKDQTVVEAMSKEISEITHKGDMLMAQIAKQAEEKI